MKIFVHKHIDINSKTVTDLLVDKYFLLHTYKCS